MTYLRGVNKIVADDSSPVGIIFVASCLSEAAEALFLFSMDPMDEFVKMCSLANSVQLVHLLKMRCFYISRISTVKMPMNRRAGCCGCACLIEDKYRDNDSVPGAHY